MSGAAKDFTEEPVVTTTDWAIVADLRRVIRGEVIIGPDLPHEASRDFGGLLRSRPTAVIRPSCSQDVADALDYASAIDRRREVPDRLRPAFAAHDVRR
jgi:hypothetical protein